MSQDDIRTAFEKKLKDLDNSFQTAYENVSFKPSTGIPYQSLSLIPLEPENPTYGDNFHREVGIFQVVLCYPIGRGTGPIKTKAEDIKEHFKRTTALTQNNTVVTIDKTPHIGAAYTIGDRYCIPVRISYYANLC